MSRFTAADCKAKIAEARAEFIRAGQLGKSANYWYNQIQYWQSKLDLLEVK